MYSGSELLTAIDSGIQTVLPLAASSQPQIVYLDFDGANTSYFNRDLDISIDKVAVEDSGFDSSTISVIVASLNGQFGDDVVFTSELPSEGEFSTIYIGVTSAFDEFGSFYGLAETIDSGNRIHDDNAFVLLDSSASAQMVVSVIAHETEHIVRGMEHEGEGLDRFAETIVVGYGVTSTALVISSENTLIVSNGGTVNSTTVNYALIKVSSGGTAIETNVISYGKMVVYSSGTAVSTIVDNNGLMDVSAGGTAMSTIVDNNGEMDVSAGGTAVKTTVNSGGRVYVMDDGTATSTTLNPGGYMRVISGGVANSTIASGTRVDSITVNSSIVSVTKGGTVNDITVIEYGSMAVYSATANNITVNSEGYVYISGGGLANSATVNVGGSMKVFDGGLATSNTLNGGCFVLSAGGTANSITVSSHGWMVLFGGTANSTTVNSGGYIDVYYGKLTGPLTIVEGAEVLVSGGVIDFDISALQPDNTALVNNLSLIQGQPTYTVTVSATQGFGIYVLAEGATGFTGSVSVRCEETNRGAVNVGSNLKGEEYEYFLANSSGTLTLAFFRSFSSGLVLENSSFIVNSGELVTNASVNGSGSLEVLSGGVANYTAVSRGSMTMNGGTANDTIVSRGTMTMNGGTANDTTVSGGGRMFVSGGTANDTTVSGGGRMFVSGGTVNNTTIHFAEVTVGGGTAVSTTLDDVAHLILSSGGTANKTTMRGSEDTFVLSGGTANDTTISNGTMTVSEGTANATTMSGGVMRLSGGTANDTIVSGGSLRVRGGTANDTIVDGGIMVMSAGTANSTTVSGGTMLMRSGGTANSTTVSGGTESGGTMTISAGTANDTIVDGGVMILSGGMANDTILSGGSMRVRGGTANDTIVSGGVMVMSNGTVNDTIVSGGSMILRSGGTANRTIVSGGTMDVSSGCANDTIVSGGTMLLSGGVLGGTLSIAEGAFVSAYSGAVIDLTVAGQKDRTAELINRYDYIGGADDATFTLTVKDKQVPGRYALAGQAQSFDGTISVRTVNGDVLGDVSLATPLENGIMEYSLSRDDAGTLMLDITVNASFTVSDPDTGGFFSFDKAAVTDIADTVGFDSSSTIYNYTDGLTATHGMEVFGNGADTTTLAGGALYLACNETSFNHMTLSGRVFGGFLAGDSNNSLSWNYPYRHGFAAPNVGDFVGSGTAKSDDTSLSFNGVSFADGTRIYGGADAAGANNASIGDITLHLEDVDGDTARVFGAGRVAGEANLIAGDIDIAISCAEGGSLLNIFAGADVATEFEGSIKCETVATVIDGGEFTYCGNGSQLRGGESVQKASTLTINSGTFKHYVYAGAFSMGGIATVNGDTLLTINGGTFNAHVFGGCGANDSENGEHTLVSGTAGVVVNTADETVTFNANLYAGSMGYGLIDSGTSMTFTGHGSKLSFAADSYVTGNSQMAKGSVQYVLSGDRTLAFDGFSGDFGANINNGFTRLVASGSNIVFTGGNVALGSIATWEIEADSADAELELGDAKNTFKGDTLELTLAEDTAPGADGWDVITGTETSLAGWDKFSSVTICGDAATYADDEWATNSYRLYKEDSTIRLAAIP